MLDLPDLMQLNWACFKSSRKDKIGPVSGGPFYFEKPTYVETMKLFYLRFLLLEQAQETRGNASLVKIARTSSKPAPGDSGKPLIFYIIANFARVTH